MTGIKQTITNNVEQIKTDSYTSLVYTQVTTQDVSLQDSEIIQIVQTDLGTVLQEVAIFQSETSIKQVTVNINKETNQVTVVEQIVVDEPEFVVPTQVIITSVELEQEYETNDNFRSIINYVQDSYTLFDQISPEQVEVEEHQTFFQYVLVYQVQENDYKNVLIIVKETGEIQVVVEPVEIGIIEPIVLETTYNEYGRVTITSNSVQELVKVDVNFVAVTGLLEEEVTLDMESVQEITVVETSQGAVYTFTSQSTEGTSQVTVLYNENEGTIVVTDIE